jgi:hypothetical protein
MRDIPVVDYASPPTRVSCCRRAVSPWNLIPFFGIPAAYHLVNNASQWLVQKNHSVISLIVISVALPLSAVLSSAVGGRLIRGRKHLLLNHNLVGICSVLVFYPLCISITDVIYGTRTQDFDWITGLVLFPFTAPMLATYDGSLIGLILTIGILFIGRSRSVSCPTKGLNPWCSSNQGERREKGSGVNGTAAVFMSVMAILLRSFRRALGHVVGSGGRVVSDDA